ncbi:hypothetical protein ACFY0G_17420 [Streptomyces sp. NPDC001552]|uniref:hypothetical protein n=1 Tax=Streptomyces sp. NPDC001552 TaxID=3364587 RepID=UPI00368D3BD9
MSADRVVMVLVYAAAYAVAVFCGAQAVDAGQHLSAAGLFVTSTGLLAGIHREFRGAARQAVAAGRQGARPPARADKTVRRTCAVPAGCSCETWWTTLGCQHDQHCPALTRKDPR